MSSKVKTPSFTIREATIDDVPALATLHVKTFIETHGEYPGAPTHQLREHQWRQAFQHKDESWFCFVMEDDNANLIGFAKGNPHNDIPGFAGELNKIYLLRKFHGKGLGRKLICKAANEFIRRGIYSMLLFGDASNPSNGFYERLGGEKLFAETGEFHGGYGWRDLHKLLADCCVER